MGDREKIKAVVDTINYLDDDDNMPESQYIKLCKVFSVDGITGLKSEIESLIMKYPDIFEFYQITLSPSFLFKYKGFGVYLQ